MYFIFGKFINITKMNSILKEATWEEFAILRMIFFVFGFIFADYFKFVNLRSLIKEEAITFFRRFERMNFWSHYRVYI